MTIQSLARTIAKVHGGTDADWLEYMGAAEAARAECMREAVRIVFDNESIVGPVVHDLERALIAQPDGAQ